jgi:hypothetical protein
MVGAGATAAAAAALLLPGRTLLAGVTGKSSRPNYPLPQLVASLEARHGRPDRILASGGPIGGSARLVFPSVPVYTPRSLERGDVQAVAAGETVLVLLDRDDDPAELSALARQVLGGDFDPDQLPGRLVELSLPELHAPGRNYPIRYAWIGSAGRS